MPAPPRKLPRRIVQTRVARDLASVASFAFFDHRHPPQLRERPPGLSRVLETPHTAQGAATFRRTLDMRDDHPAKMNLTGLCAIEVSTPHGQNLLHRRPSLPCRATSINGEGNN